MVCCESSQLLCNVCTNTHTHTPSSILSPPLPLHPTISHSFSRCYKAPAPEEGFKWDEEPSWVTWPINVKSTYVWTQATVVRAVILPLMLSFFLVFLHILVCKSIDGNYCQPAVLPATVVTIAAFFHVFGDPKWPFFVLLCIASWTALVFHNRTQHKVVQGLVTLFVFATLAAVLGGLSQSSLVVTSSSLANQFPNLGGGSGNGNEYITQTSRQGVCTRYWGAFKIDPGQYSWFETERGGATATKQEMYSGYCRADYTAFLDLLTILAVIAYLYLTVRMIAKFGDLNLAFLERGDLNPIAMARGSHSRAARGDSWRERNNRAEDSRANNRPANNEGTEMSAQGAATQVSDRDKVQSAKFTAAAQTVTPKAGGTLKAGASARHRPSNAGGTSAPERSCVAVWLVVGWPPVYVGCLECTSRT